MSPRYIAVIGPGDDATAEDVARGREVGRLLAEAGAIVLTGGLGGVMAAATSGATEAGGLTVALLPGTDRSASQATVVVPTGLGELRNGLLVRAADGVLAVGGSWGTLSEIALAQRTGVPVLLLGGWRLTDAAGAPVPVERSDGPKAAVERILRACQAPSAPSS